jgi:hypothetical protein
MSRINKHQFIRIGVTNLSSNFKWFDQVPFTNHIRIGVTNSSKNSEVTNHVNYHYILIWDFGG